MYAFEFVCFAEGYDAPSTGFTGEGLDEYSLFCQLYVVWSQPRYFIGA